MAERPRRINKLSDMVFDEVSTVDRGANQHAPIVIAKAAKSCPDCGNTDGHDDMCKSVVEKHGFGQPHDMFSNEENKQYRADTTFGQRVHNAVTPGAREWRKASYRATYEGHPKLAGATGQYTGHGAGATAHVAGEQLGGAVVGGTAGALAGHKLAGSTGALVGGVAGEVAGMAAGGAHAGTVIQHHYHLQKNIGWDPDCETCGVVRKDSPTQGNLHVNRPLGDEEDDEKVKKFDQAEVTSHGMGGPNVGDGVMASGRGSGRGADESAVLEQSSPGHGANRQDVDRRDEDETADLSPVHGPDLGDALKTKKKAKYPSAAKNMDHAGTKVEGPDSGQSAVGRTSGVGEYHPDGKKQSVGKREPGFWQGVLSKIFVEEEDVTKHFPGQPQGQGSVPPSQPQMQSAATAPPVVGKPAPPPPQGAPGLTGQTTGPVGVQGLPPGQGMPGQPMPQPQVAPQLPPEVIAYIQQLEAMIAELTGDDDNSDQGSNNNANNTNNSYAQSGSDKRSPFGKGESVSSTSFLEELAKSLEDDDQREQISKAMELVSKAEERAQEAENIAKAERDLRLEREFVAKAGTYESLPVKPEELGPVLKRCYETLAREDVAVLEKCLGAANEQIYQSSLFGEIGKRGGGANASISDEVEARAQEFMQGGQVSKAEAIAKAYETDPALYDEYMRNHPSRR